MLALRIGFLAVLPCALAAGAAGDPIVGYIGQQRVTESDLTSSHRDAFEQLADNYETERHQVESKYARVRYDLVKRQLDQELDAAALEREAQAREVTPREVLRELTVKAITDEDVHRFYEANRERIREPLDQVAAKILDYLSNQEKEATSRRFYDALRVKYDIRSALGPYRVALEARGPARGAAAAPVTIVEFADFQCPYCKRAEASLQALLAQYPREVRLVFRNLPLTQIHPHAQVAAQAGVCAGRQGKFWQMHDAMYADQSALTVDALADTAKRLGLEPDRFSACLRDGAARDELAADAKAARDLGLSGTPYFFVDGRPLDGNVPLATFQAVIGEELKAADAVRGAALRDGGTAHRAGAAHDGA